MKINEIKSVKEFYHSPFFFLWQITRDDEEIHPCFNCTGIQNEFDERIDKEETLCSYETFDDFLGDIREICDNCWCTKYGGKSWMVRNAENCEGRVV